MKKILIFNLVMVIALLSTNTSRLFAQQTNESSHMSIRLKDGKEITLPIKDVEQIYFHQFLLNQMPLISAMDEVKDKEKIAEYEAKIGRILKDKININNDNSSERNELPAYVNKELSVIPIVAYGIQYSLMNRRGILALGREEFKKTTILDKWLQEAGFKKSFDSDESCIWAKDDMEIIIQPWQNSEHNTRISISITAPAPAEDIDIEHAPINTKELLSLSEFKDEKSASDFEKSLGLREEAAKYDNVYIMYKPIEGKENLSNISLLFYWPEKHQITGKLCCLKNIEEAFSNTKFNEWLKSNGFTSSIKRIKKGDYTAVLVESTDAKMCIYYEPNSIKFEIIEKKK